MNRLKRGISLYVRTKRRARYFCVVFTNAPLKKTPGRVCWGDRAVWTQFTP